MRLLLVDRSEPLTPSAAAAGAIFNDQVTSFDASGVESTWPLEIPDSAHGIGIETELVVPLPKERILAVLAASSNGTSSTLSGVTGSATTVSGTNVPSATVPGTTAPSTAVPGATMPGSTVPGTI